MCSNGEKGDDLIRVLRELTAVQRKIADLQVELQGRKVKYNILYLLSLLFHLNKAEKWNEITYDTYWMLSLLLN